MEGLQKTGDTSKDAVTPSHALERPRTASAGAVSGSTKQAILLAKRLSERGRPGRSGGAVGRAPVVFRLPGISSAHSNDNPSNKLPRPASARVDHHSSGKTSSASSSKAAGFSSIADQQRPGTQSSRASPRICFENKDAMLGNAKDRQVQLSNDSKEAMLGISKSRQVQFSSKSPRSQKLTACGFGFEQDSEPSAGASNQGPLQIECPDKISETSIAETANILSSEASTYPVLWDPVPERGIAVNTDQARKLFHRMGIPGHQVAPATCTELSRVAGEGPYDGLEGILPEIETGLLDGDDQSAEALIAALWNAALHHEGGNQFVYARCKESIYEIEVLPFSSCPRLQNSSEPQTWVTIASGGLTFHKHDENGEEADEEFVDLSQWVRDRKQFFKLKKLRWCKTFAFRKMLMKWKHAIANSAHEAAMERLENRLLFLRPEYYETLCWLHTFCQTRLPKSAIVSRHCRGKQSIAVFREVIHTGRQEAAVLVAKLDGELHIKMTRVCEDIFEQVVEREFRGPMPTRAIRQRPTVAESALHIPGHKLTQTSRVRLQHECQHICRLVRLSNFVLKHHLIGLCRQEFFRILDAVGLHENQSPRALRSEPIVFIVKVISKDATSSAGDSLRIGELALETDAENICRTLREAVNGAVETLQVFRVLTCNQEFAKYADVADRNMLHSNMKCEPVFDGSREDEHVFGPREYWPGFRFDGDLFTEEAITKAMRTATTVINDAFDAAHKHVKETESAIANFKRSRIADASNMETSEDPAALLDEQIRLYVKNIQHFEEVPERINLGVLELDMKSLKQRIVGCLRESLRAFAVVLPKLVSGRTKTCAAWVDAGLDLLRRPFPEYVGEFVPFLKKVQALSSEVPRVRNERQQLKEILDLSDEFKLYLNKDHHTAFASFSANFSSLIQELQGIEAVILKRTGIFVTQLDAIRPRLMGKVQDVFDQVMSVELIILKTSQGQLDPDSEPPSQGMLESGELELELEDAVEEANAKEKLQILDALSENIASVRKEVEELTEQQDALYVRNNTCQTLLASADTTFDLRQKLWTCVLEWHQNISLWADVDFRYINVDEVSNACNKLGISVSQLPSTSISVEIQSRIKIMNVACDLLQTLQTTELKDRHWQQFAQLLGANVNDNDLKKGGLPFSELMNLGFLSSSLAAHELCHRAMQENAIEQQLQNLDEKWSIIRLQAEANVHGLSDLFIVNMADISEEVDDSCMVISSMATSAFVRPFKESVRFWQQQLLSMEETLDAWLDFQTLWCMLRPILTRPDIAAYAPEDDSLEVVEEWWENLMTSVVEQAECLAIKALLEPGRSDDIKQHSAILEKMQVDLDGLMEDKRMGYPRLYFVASSDVLEMMRDEYSIVCMQPHVQKCFDGIDDILLEVKDEETGDIGHKRSSLFFNDGITDGKDTKVDVSVGMASEQGELLFWGRMRHVPKLEVWLSLVGHAMVRVLRRQCWMALGALRGEAHESSEALSEYILTDLYCAQASMMALMVSWCCDVESMLKHEAGQDRSKSKMLEEHRSSTLEIMCKALDTDHLAPVKRTSLLAQITLQVFFRDVADFLHNARVSDVSDFEWQRQQRWYWDVGVGHEATVSGGETLELVMSPVASSNRAGQGLCMRQISLEFPYGFEYYGVTHRIVVTPLTERCWVTITQAIANKYSTMLFGPPGTGKTESTKDLAKGLGVQCIVFNFSEDTDSKITRRLLCGLAQSGAWLCLNEFDRIAVEVLSVIAAQILTLRRAVLACMHDVDFEGQRISLRSLLGLVATTNPRLAGRHELPDNLKVLFRPFAMIRPDFESIAHVLLFVEGFRTAKSIARRLAFLYRCASQQLRQESHYDFGLRLLKHVLELAAAILRSDSSISEEAAVVRAVCIANVPKLVAEDQVLFHGLVSDVFVDIAEKPDATQLTILDRARDVIMKHGLEISEMLCRKVVQIKQTLHMQTGTMVIGPPGSAKSTAFKVFAEVERGLAEDMVPGFQDMDIKMMNPKVFTREELFGSVSSINSQWKDGLLPHLLRPNPRKSEITHLEKTSTFLIGFDGPVDPGWTEDMNTLLDDNRTLCLASAERLHVSSNVRVLFETQTLEQASPAVVSRCGIVHIAASDVGWQPYLSRWARLHLPVWLSEDDRKYLKELFSKLPAAMDFRRTLSRTSCLTADMQVVAAFAHLMELVFTSEPRAGKAINPVREMSEKSPKARHILLEQARIPPEERRSLRRAADDPPFHTRRYLSASVIFALAWSVGNVSGASDRNDFHKWCLRNMPGFSMPLQCTVHDVFVDWSCEPQFLRPWHAYMQGTPRLDLSSFQTLQIHTATTVSHGFLGIMMNRQQHHVIIDGAKGSGKSLIAQIILQHLWTVFEWSVSALHFSRKIESREVQEMVEASHERTSQGFKAPSGKQVLIHIDDVNMPASDEYGSQPPLELLRQLVDSKGFFDRQRWHFRSVVDTVLLMTPSPGVESEEAAPQRFSRHCFVFRMPSPSTEGLALIFAPILQQFFSCALPDGSFFTHTVAQLHETLCNATAEIYQAICSELPATPSHFYYAYSLRDALKVVHGLLLANPTVIVNKMIATRLWAHEVVRVFGDRLKSDQHQLKFHNMLSTVLRVRFGTEWHPGLEATPLRFSCLDFSTEEGAHGDSIYREVIRDEKQISKSLTEDLHAYNVAVRPPLSMLALVFFSAAISHICRVHRILLEPGGHVMSVGLPGTGKRSLCLFAAFLADSPASIPSCMGNGEQQAIKDALIDCGLHGDRRILLFSDNHFGRSDSIVDMVNTLLRSGDVGCAWSSEERDFISAKLSQPTGLAPPATARTLPDDPIAEPLFDTSSNRHMVWRDFLRQSQKFFHMVLCCSPAGTQLRTWCRFYPGLIRSCTLDLFTSWPDEALFAVALHFFSDNTDAGLDVARKVCDQVHTLTEAACKRSILQQQRHVYVCPQTYIEFLGIFKDKYRAEVDKKRRKQNFLQGGQRKLKESNDAIARLSEEIARLEPKLLEQAELTKALMEKLVRNKDDAREVQEFIAKEREIMDEVAQKAAARSAEANAELARSEPLYRYAVSAVDKLDKRSIQELRVMLNPPRLVQVVLQCVCMLLGQPEDWAGARALLGDLSLLKRLKAFDKDNIPADTAEKLKVYVNLPEFEPEEIGKQSRAARELSQWCRSLLEYHRMKASLDKKFANTREMERNLEEMKQALAVKVSEYDAYTEQMNMLEQRHRDATESLNELHKEIDICRARQARASQLIRATKDEAQRWEDQETRLKSDLETLPGDVVLSAAFIAYIGAFTPEVRNELSSQWIDLCGKEGVELSTSVQFQRLYVEPSTIYSWQINGLPADSNSADSAILVMHSAKWPYIVDPQQQASMWLRKQEQSHQLKEVKMSDANLLRTMVICLRAGVPVLIDDCAEDFPVSLDPVLAPINVNVHADVDSLIMKAETSEKMDRVPSNKRRSSAASLAHASHVLSEKRASSAIANREEQAQARSTGQTRSSAPSVRFSSKEPVKRESKRSTSKQSGRRSSFEQLAGRSSQGASSSVCVGDDTIHLEATFRLYLVTSIANPHVNPRLSLMLNLVNFGITLEGLTSQLLCEVLKVEAPELEKERIHVLQDWSSNLKELDLCETRILTTLCEADTLELLDNEDLVVALQKSFRVRSHLQSRVKDEEQRDATLRSTCAMYKSIAEHGAHVYIAVLAIAKINPLYVVSLSQVVRCFVAALTEFKAYAKAKNYEKWNMIETDIGQRRDSLNEEYLEEMRARILHSVFAYASRALFLQDRLAFSFVLSVNLCLQLGRMTKQHYAILMTGTDALFELSEDRRKKGFTEMAKQGNTNVPRYSPDATIIPSSNWEMVRALAVLLPQTFLKLPADILDDLPRWREALPEARPGQHLIQVSKEEVDGEDAGTQVAESAFQRSGTLVHEQFGVSLCEGFPAPWNSMFMEPIEQLLLIRALLPARLIHGIAGFVHRYMGPRFVDVSPVRFEDVYKESDCRTPILISLMPGSDPTSAIMDCAQGLHLDPRSLHIMSMAHGQASKALEVVSKSVSDGSWVLLQNCHLAPNWLEPLVSFAVKMVNDMGFKIHGDFRLFITTQAFPDFPMALLQSSLKVAFESPSGVRSRLLRSVSNVSLDDWFSYRTGGASHRSSLTSHGTNQGTATMRLAWRRLLYGLCLFHAVASERSSFGPVGFTIPYEFDDGDFASAREVLRIIFQDLAQDASGPAEMGPQYATSQIAGHIPWTSLYFVLSEIEYGGRIGDEWDLRCLQCSLRRFISKDLIRHNSFTPKAEMPVHRQSIGFHHRDTLTIEGASAEGSSQENNGGAPEKKYKVCESYNRVPNFILAESPESTYKLVVKTAETLPAEEPLELFGLSPQAEVLLQDGRSRALLGKLQAIYLHDEVSMQPVSSHAHIVNADMQDEAVLHEVKVLRDELPPVANPYDDDVAEMSPTEDPGSTTEPRSLFLQHEQDRALESLRQVHDSLAKLEEALNGRIPMSNQVESLRLSILGNQVPSMWLSNKWEPQKSLASWIKSLAARIKYFRQWSRKSEVPYCFVITAFYNPRGFLTTILQQEARNRAISVDVFTFRHTVCTALEEPADVQEPPEIGVYLYGMWLQSARWDTAAQVIADCRDNESWCLMPIVLFIPEADYEPDFDKVYRAPCYQTVWRSGWVDTTGQSTNLVTTVDLPFTLGGNGEKWALRGVALICQLDD